MMRINKPLILLFTFFYLIVSGFGITADDLSVFSGTALSFLGSSALLASAEAAASSDALLITSPANGTTVPHDISSFAVNLPSGTIETIFTLDGKALGRGEADGSFTLPEDFTLTLGNHTLTVTAVYDDGTGEKKDSNFTVAIIPRQTIDFEEYSALSDAGTAIGSITSVGMESTLGESKNYIYTDSITNSLALKFNNEEGKELGAANSQLYFYAGINKSKPTEGVMGLEFDFYMSHYGVAYMQFIPWHSGGDNISVRYNDKNAQNIINAGKADWTGANVTTGWHHLKAVVNLDNMTLDISVDGYAIPQRTLAFKDGTSNANKHLYKYNIRMSTDVGKYWAIDNIETYEIGNYYSGASEILFEADSGALISADSAGVSRSTQKLVLKVNKKLQEQSVTASNISVTAAGKSVPLAAAPIYDAEAKTITLTLNNSNGITGNGDSYVKLSENIKFADGTSVGTAAINRFNLEPDGFLIKSVDFKFGTSELFTSSQLDIGDAIKADITIQNAASSDANFTAVLVVKSGNKILSVTPKAITAAANELDCSANIQAPALTTKENITASLIFVDDLKNALYIDSYDLI